MKTRYKELLAMLETDLAKSIKDREMLLNEGMRNTSVYMAQGALIASLRELIASIKANRL